jgi:hypothetical protein
MNSKRVLGVRQKNDRKRVEDLDDHVFSNIKGKSMNIPHVGDSMRKQ